MNKINHHHALLSIALLIFALVLPIEAREWSFTRDTVYGYGHSSFSDTSKNFTDIVSNLSETLAFDSLQIELLAPGLAYFQFGFRNTSSTFNVFTYQKSGEGSFIPSANNQQILESITIPPFTRVKWFDFDLHPQLISIPSMALSKSSAQSAMEDTIKARIIFVASQQRGRDTLLLLGVQKRPDYVGLIPRSNRRSPSANRLQPSLYQVDGRVLTKRVLLPKALVSKSNP